ncbi:uncharacterized protein KY384_007660 [Bacidia gigantensis]|uniref:uncharacterized protein n=1 Tax=Bacidia gigantensis TaxID=2732470 RepID=UPI001D047F50|nr:uncharacterized protein KY384_007660 [Bacidia gigantensis]KAG8527508.1 hypothetical protein KY384_007660 [Bacidia gigantensis]
MPLEFDPPILNSANPWATTFEDLLGLFRCPSIGAVTTRTSLLRAFGLDASIHQHCFVESVKQSEVLKPPISKPQAITSLNTYGYSPYSLSQYLQWITQIYESELLSYRSSQKPVIFSVTGTAEEIQQCHTQIAENLTDVLDKGYFTRFFMEINLSCPNIDGKPPPAYSRESLETYLAPLNSPDRNHARDLVPIGIKTPPYTYHTQFAELIAALLNSCHHTNQSPIGSCPISFITATNTLGSSLLLAPMTDSAVPTNGNANNIPAFKPALSSVAGTGIGGLAGAALHPLALGNVCTLRWMLDEHDELRGIEIIGVGGVSDSDGYERMRSVGAAAVGVGTALGFEGVGIFARILDGKEKELK